MARRVVMVGPRKGGVVWAAEVSPGDGHAFLDSGGWRVSLSLYDSELADATTLFSTLGTWEEQVEQWKGVLLLSTTAKQFVLDVPLSVST